MPTLRLFAILLLVAVLGGCAQATSATGADPVAAPATHASAPSPTPTAASSETPLDEVTGTWYSADGEVATRSASSFEVHGIRGHPHCDTQSVVFLSVLWPIGRQLEEGEELDPRETRQYIRDSESKLGGAGALAGELDLAAELPAEATNSGYHTDSVELWLGPDGGDRYVYLVFDSHTERWPRAREFVVCA